jgi:hypothetical protein
VDGVLVEDRIGLSDPVRLQANVHVLHLPLDTEYENL